MPPARVEAFRKSLAAETPPGDLSLALQALWWAGKGDWNRAHACAQEGEGVRDCDHVHAHLHRQEGDLPNARYWYGRARQSVPTISLEEEWASIAASLLRGPDLRG